jgi:integron integrase
MTDDARPPPLGLFADRPVPRLYDRAVQVLQTKHYSPRTQKSYLGWIRRFIEFHKGRHPRELDEENVNEFLTYLATERDVAAATQNQALSAVLFLYKHVLEQPLGWIDGLVRAKRAKKLPVVLTPDEAMAILELVEGVPSLVLRLQYGGGLRLLEALSLRVKDLDFERGEITVRSGKGDKDRRTVLPAVLKEPLRAHLLTVREQHDADLKRRLGRVPMPGALARKYPNADRDWAWQWVFPARSHYTDRRTGVRHRHHLHESVVGKALKPAVQRSGVPKKVTTHSFRHSFATDLIRAGYDIRTLQELMGHESVRTTQIYTHVLNRGGLGVRSPLDMATDHRPTAPYADHPDRYPRTPPSTMPPIPAGESPDPAEPPYSEPENYADLDEQ